MFSVHGLIVQKLTHLQAITPSSQKENTTKQTSVFMIRQREQHLLAHQSTSSIVSHSTPGWNFAALPNSSALSYASRSLNENSHPNTSSCEPRAWRGGGEGETEAINPEQKNMMLIVFIRLRPRQRFLKLNGDKNPGRRH